MVDCHFIGQASPPPCAPGTSRSVRRTRDPRVSERNQDAESLGRLVDYYLQSGISGLRILGESSEIEKLSAKEKRFDSGQNRIFEIGTSEALLVLYRIRSTVLGSLRLRVGSD